MESWCKSQRVWMRAMSFHAKNMGWIGQIQSFVTGKWIITCVFLCIQRKTETIWKYRILFVEVYEAGSVRSVKTVGNPAGAAALQNGAFPAKITLPRPVGGSGERSVWADGQFVRGQNPSGAHGASLYIRRDGRTAQLRKQAADSPGNSQPPRMYSMISPM